MMCMAATYLFIKYTYKKELFMKATDLLMLDISNRLKLLSKEFESEVLEKIKTLIHSERKDVKNKQLFTVKAILQC